MAERRAKKEIEKRMDASICDGASYTIDKCVYTSDNDSCFIFSGELISSGGIKGSAEYLYRQRKDDLLVAFKNLDFGGSLLRNMNKKANSGNEAMDEMVNRALEKSGLGLSITIYSDLQDGALVDITYAVSNNSKTKPIEPPKLP